MRVTSLLYSNILDVPTSSTWIGWDGMEYTDGQTGYSPRHLREMAEILINTTKKFKWTADRTPD